MPTNHNLLVAGVPAAAGTIVDLVNHTIGWATVVGLAVAVLYTLAAQASPFLDSYLDYRLACKAMKASEDKTAVLREYRKVKRRRTTDP